MDFEDTPDEAAFRAEARAWLEANAIEKGSPDDFSSPYQGDPQSLAEFEAIERDWVDRCKWWQGMLHDGGWAGIGWPTEYGGRAGSVIEEAIFAEEDMPEKWSKYKESNAKFFQ